jgi:hypothetical protein
MLRFEVEQGAQCRRVSRCVCTAQEKIRDVFRITHCLVAELVSSRHKVRKTYLSHEVILIITKHYNSSSLPITL